MKLAVLGSPIEHSLSPDIHGAAIAFLKLPWEYSRVRLEKSDFTHFFAELDDSWLGFSVTMPLKESAFALASSHCHFARLTGAVNTLRREGDLWAGFNTDVMGLAMALQDHDFDLSDTVILGGGSTSESAIYALRELGAKNITIVARREEQAREVAGNHGCAWLSISDSESLAPSTVLSTLPPQAGESFVIPEDFYSAKLFDVAYNPWPSALAKRWMAKNGDTVSGVHMLLSQAILQLRIFVNGSPEEELPEEKQIERAMQKSIGL